MGMNEERKYSEMFKIQMVNLYKNGMTKEDIISDNNLELSNLEKWIEQYSDPSEQNIIEKKSVTPMKSHDNEDSLSTQEIEVLSEDLTAALNGSKINIETDVDIVENMDDEPKRKRKRDIILGLFSNKKKQEEN